MNTVVQQSPQSTTFDLLAYYRLEADRSPHAPTKIQVLDRWLHLYPEEWVRLALIESLYQGRYKAISVEQLLALWHRRGEPVYHFNHEFEHLVCHNVPQQMGKNPRRRSQVNRPQSSTQSQDQPVDALSLEGASVQDGRSPANITAPKESLNDDCLANRRQVDVSIKVQPYVRDQFDDPWTDSSDSQRSTILDLRQLLPITMGHLGIEPIHQFMPEAQPVEFCEKLEAIAAHQESARFPS